MKRALIFFLLLSIICVGQNDTIYILIERPFFVKNSTSISVGFGIKSKDHRFNLDYYQFRVINYRGWDKNGNDIYLDLEHLRQKQDITSIKHYTVKDLSEKFEWWEIHNELSLKNRIFLLERKKGAFNSETKEFNFEYFSLPVEYEGTRKNIVPTDLSNSKD